VYEVNVNGKGRIEEEVVTDVNLLNVKEDLEAGERR
jgi:hypothetical protein